MSWGPKAVVLARYTTKRTLGLALIPTLIAACDNPLGNGDVEWLRATIQDAVRVQFEGSGFFEEARARAFPPWGLPL